MNITTEYILTLISNHELENAIRELYDFLEKSKYKNEIILQSSRYYEVQTLIRQGVIGHDEAFRHKSNIIKSIIELVGLIDDEKSLQQNNASHLEKIINAQSEIADLIIETWRESEIIKIKNEPDYYLKFIQKNE